jgi:hypothetical protein
MITTILAVLDRLIALTKRKATKRKELFTTTVEPVFGELLAIHRDYVSMFEQTRKMFPSVSEDPLVAASKMSGAVTFLRDQRVALAPIREKVKHLATEYQKAQLDPYVDKFAEVAAAYLLKPIGGGKVGKTPASHLLDSLTGDCVSDLRKEWQQADDDLSVRHKLSAREAHDLVRRFVDTLNASWSEVCVAYAELRAIVAKS